MYMSKPIQSCAIITDTVQTKCLVE